MATSHGGDASTRSNGLPYNIRSVKDRCEAPTYNNWA
jgi:hypothetical protein